MMGVISTLRRTQKELNERRHRFLLALENGAQLVVNYGEQMPQYTWVIDPDGRGGYVDVIDGDLSNVYRDAYLAWDNFFSHSDGYMQHFGTSPVRNAYWKIEDPRGPFIWRDHVLPQMHNRMDKRITPPVKNPTTMVFRRFPDLPTEPAPWEMDSVLLAFLGIPEIIGWKINPCHAILNDSWTVNLMTTPENIMMDSFLRGMGKEMERLSKQWDNTPPHMEKQMGIDVSDELKDLFRVYTDAQKHLESKEKTAMNHLVNSMEAFLKVYKEKQSVDYKLNTLKYKIKDNCDPKCDCEDEDEDGDDDE